MRGFLQHIVPFDDLAVLIFDRPGTDPEGGAQAGQAFAPDVLPDPFASRFEQEFSSGIETSDLFDKFLGLRVNDDLPPAFGTFGSFPDR